MPNNDELPERPRSPAQAAGHTLRRVDFVTERESFNVYSLSDGNVLKLKLVLTGVKTVVGVRNQAGEPVYEPQFTIAAAVEEGD